MPRRLIIVCALFAFAAPARAAPDSAALFEADLSRLSEILGALHYLREVCGANEGQKWREQMQALVEAEGQPPERRAKFITSFNRGYRGFQQTYRSCTPAANLAIRRPRRGSGESRGRPRGCTCDTFAGNRDNHD